MNITEINKKFQVLALFLILGMLYCCTDENEGHKVLAGKEKLVSFSVGVPGSGTPKTYALEEDDENEVKNIVILLFDSEGKYIYQPIYINKISTDNNDSKIKTFTAKVPEGTYKHMVLLANSNSIVSNVLNEIATGDLKDEVCSKLLITNNGKWNTSPGSSGYIGIPMWGEISDITVNSAMTENNPVNLVRMVAKIDVALSATSQTKFKLKSLRLYNYNDKGQVVPDDSNWNTVQNQVIITDPSVPATAQRVQGPLVYDNNAITTTNVSCVGEIYAFEAVAGTSDALTDNTCLVIGGVYGDDSRETFYRVDFANTTSENAENATYLALLRNHHYRVTITDVSASGLGTPDEAFNSRPVNIVAGVVEWDDSDISEIVFDGQYMMGVSKGEFSFSQEARTIADNDNILSVTTDYPTGWKVEKIVDAADNDINSTSNPATGWLDISPAAGSSGPSIKTHLLLKANATDSERTGFIHLSAGRLTYIVKVTQTTIPKIEIQIKNALGIDEITELLFYAPVGTAPEAQKFIVSWAPVANECTITSYAVGSYAFDYAGGDILGSGGYTQTTGGGTGLQTFTISPPAISEAETDTVSGNPFIEKMSKVDFNITNGISYLSKSIYLRQINYTLIASGHDKGFFMDGKQYSFTVKSNDAWTAAITDNSKGVLKSLDITSGSGNTSTGESLLFTVVDDISSQNAGSIGSGTFDITFTSVNGKFPPKTYSIYCISGATWAGSNIYWNGTTLTFDDSSNGYSPNETYQGVYFKWGSLWGISPQGDTWVDFKMTIYLPNPNNDGYSEYTATTWDAIKPWAVDETLNDDRDRKYLSELAVHNEGNIAKGFGDICKYLTEQAGGTLHGKKWRMPTSNEFNSADPNDDEETIPAGSSTDYKWEWDALAAEPANDSGTARFPNGVRKSKDGGAPFFPASGFRVLNMGNVGQSGAYGYYWTSSPCSKESYYGYFGKSNVYPWRKTGRVSAMSIRCVVDK